MEIIRWLYGLQHFGIKLGLDNIRALLRILDHPERSYPAVLVAGTNGKGSVAAMLHAMLGASGIPAGLFTSPHLMRPNERIRLGERDIDDAALDSYLHLIRARIESGLAAGELEAHPSFFEVITAAALLAFRDGGMRAAVLEVGLGGRLDATNAVDAELSVIVGVDLDHMKILGPTVPQIAVEKAGIIKPGKPIVSGVVQQQAVTVVQRTCREHRATFVDARLAVELVAEAGETFTLETKDRIYPDLRLALSGRHQIDNARIALAAFEQFAPTVGLVPDAAAVRRALASVRWPGRLEWRPSNGARPELLFDGAHNPAGTRVLAAYLRGLVRRSPVTLFGAMQGKAFGEMFATLAPLLGPVVITRPTVERAEEPESIVEEARRHSLHQVEVLRDPRAAFERACYLAPPGAFVLVTGSLYLIGEILALLEPRPTPGPVSM